MLIEHDEPVKTHGKSGHEGEAERDGGDHDRDRRDPVAALPQLEPAEVVPGSAGHYERHEPEHEGKWHRVRGIQ